MVQEKLEYCNSFCVLRPAAREPRCKSMVHAADHFYRNYEFQRGKEIRS